MCAFYRVDWSATGSMIGGIGGMLAGLAAIALAVAGFRGLSAWKLQLTATRKLNLSDELLKALYEADEILKFITAPFMSGGELTQIQRKDGESEQDYRLRQNYEAVNNRYLSHLESFNKLRALCFSAKAVFGNEVFDAAVKVVTFPQTILSAASRLRFAEQAMLRLDRQLEIGLDVDPRNYESVRSRFNSAHSYFYGLDEDHQLDKDREKAVDDVETLIRKELGNL